MPFDIITITPTLSTSAYADNDVLFVSTAVKLPHSKCKIVSLDAIFTDTDTATPIEMVDKEFIAFFFKENTHDLGTITAAASITGAQMATNVFLGAVRVVNDTTGEVSLGVPSLFCGQHVNDAGVASSSVPNLVLAEGSTKNTCYIQGLYEIGGAATYEASDLVITIGVEY
jgi:hypothetical protein